MKKKEKEKEIKYTLTNDDGQLIFKIDDVVVKYSTLSFSSTGIENIVAITVDGDIYSKVEYIDLKKEKFKKETLDEIQKFHDDDNDRFLNDMSKNKNVKIKRGNV